MAQRVFVDANVLFGRTLYDWLFLLRIESRGGLFQLHTSWDVINEAGTRLRDEHPEWDGEEISSLMSKVQDIFDEIIEVFPGGQSRRYGRFRRLACSPCGRSKSCRYFTYTGLWIFF